MLTRAVGAMALSLTLSSFSSGAIAAEGHVGPLHRVSCSMVRFYVAKYSASAAEMWARSRGASDAQIEAARRCLADAPAQTVQPARW